MNVSLLNQNLLTVPLNFHLYVIDECCHPIGENMNALITQNFVVKYNHNSHIFCSM